MYNVGDKIEFKLSYSEIILEGVIRHRAILTSTWYDVRLHTGRIALIAEKDIIKKINNYIEEDE